MSALLTRLERLYAEGQARPRPELWVDPRTRTMTHFKPASVLLAITDRPDNPGMLFIHRSATLRTHAGEIALPGGRREAGEDAVRAALREAHEELSIPPTATRIIGTSDIYRTRSGYEITPVIAMISPDITLVPHQLEVESWFEAPLNHVLDPAHHLLGHVMVDGISRRFIEIVWNGHRIWGVTAAILANLAHRLDWTDQISGKTMDG